MCKIAHFTLQTTMAKHKVSIRLEFNMNAGDVAASEGILFDFIGIECKVYCFLYKHVLTIGRALLSQAL